MFELTINGVVYKFRFGMGFMRELNKQVTVPVEGMPGVSKEVGMRYKLAGLFDNDLCDLVEILFAANKTENPRVTKGTLDEYIDTECEDIEGLFAAVIDFLSGANVTKKDMKDLKELAEQEKAKAKAKMAAQ